jgi:cytochrome c-type biogenesis protein CcmE
MIMTPTRKRRLIAVLVIIAGVGLAAIVAFNALQENMLFFVSPTDVEEQSLPTGKRFRLGGLVAMDSVTRADDSLAVMFVVTDGLASVDVRYDGILPDLFREGQGIIAIGELRPEGYFEAAEVLAKHDENYMPPEVADALEKAGHTIESAEKGT